MDYFVTVIIAAISWAIGVKMGIRYTFKKIEEDYKLVNRIKML